MLLSFPVFLLVVLHANFEATEATSHEANYRGRSWKVSRGQSAMIVICKEWVNEKCVLVFTTFCFIHVFIFFWKSLPPGGTVSMPDWTFSNLAILAQIEIKWHLISFWRRRRTFSSLARSPQQAKERHWDSYVARASKLGSMGWWWPRGFSYGSSADRLTELSTNWWGAEFFIWPVKTGWKKLSNLFLITPLSWLYVVVVYNAVLNLILICSCWENDRL